MANATPPNPENTVPPTRPPSGNDVPYIKKGAVEARQGRGGQRVLIILAISLALLGILYFVIHGFFAGTPHQTVSASPRPIFTAAKPVLASGIIAHQ